MSSRPRVLFVSKPIAPPWHDGSKNLVRDVAENLVDAVPTVMTTEAFSEANDLRPFVRVEPVYREGGGFSPALFANARVLSRLLRGEPHDLWHFVFAPNPASSAAALFAKRFRRALGFRGPVVQTIASAPRSFDGVARLVFGDRVVALSEWTRGRLVGAGVKGVPIEVIPPCARAPEVPAEADVEALRQKHGLFGKVVLYPGDIEHSRGARNVVSAFPGMLSRHPDVTLVLACRKKTPRAEGAERELSDAIARAGLSSKVRFVGEVASMPTLLAASDVVAFPVDDLYGKVDVPLVLLEALALGVPMVVAGGGPLEALGDAAHVVPLGDDEALAHAVVTLFSPDARARAAEAGKELHRARFSPEVVGRAHDRLYADALGGGAPRSG
ncbi:MAG: glycosyltransferase family 4 protein [Myxococcales bacterium]|nr:glycosyltransferase family 4 protein [Myxococcales bacterium]